MIASPRSRSANISRAAAPVVLIGLAAAALLCLPPAQYSFYPQCPIYRSLHLLCPGCGTTRALAALLRGHLGEALRINALTTLMIPIAAGYAVRRYRRFVRREAVQWPRLPSGVIYAMLGVTAVFTIARNLPR